MGLFSKKPKQPATETPAVAATYSGPARRSDDQPPAVKPRKAKKITIDQSDLVALHRELTVLKGRLEAAERAEAKVETHLAALDAATTALSTERPGSDDMRTHLADLEAQLATVAEAATAATAKAAYASAQATAAATVASNAAAAPAVAVGPDPTLSARIDAIAAQAAAAQAAAANEGLAAQLAQLAERVSAGDNAARLAAEQVANIELRLEAVSTELANQVTELGRDIDGLAAQSNEAAPDPVIDETIDGVKTAQVKLAAEQARYEIAFRQDLAALADQVRRNPKG